MKLSRRKFIILSFLGITSLFFLDAFWIEKYLVDWSGHDLRDHGMTPVKFIQLTDMHIREEKAYHRWMARRINKEKPDLLFFTGDSINRPSQLPFLEAFLKQIENSIPKVVIMGNKEYDGNVTPEALHELFSNYNGRLLLNEAFVFTKGERRFNIIGIDDFVRGTPDFKVACHGLDPSTETIILNHCPEYRDTIDILNKSIQLKIKLILCGHTHGGQIQLFGKAFYTPGGSGRYLNGFYKSEQSLMYVSKGIGTSYLPARFGARAEAPIFYV